MVAVAAMFFAIGSLECLYTPACQATGLGELQHSEIKILLRVVPVVQK